MQDSEFFEYLEERFFKVGITANSKAELLDQMIEPLLEHEVIKNKNIILETLKKRESLGSTGIGRGVAIPHCRTLSVSEVKIVIGLSAAGVNYEASDDKPVHLFFLIVAPPQESANVYLPILGKFVEMLRNDMIRNALIESSSYENFMEILRKGENDV